MPLRMFYKLEPEEAGHLDLETDIDTSVRPPVVHALHYVFDGWLGDDLISSFPCFIVTRRLQKLLESASASGCRFCPVQVSRSEQFEELHPGRELPGFSRILADGIARRDDFATSSTGGALIVSERILQVMLKGARLDHCIVSEVA